MHRSSWARLRSSTGPNVLIVPMWAPPVCGFSPRGWADANRVRGRVTSRRAWRGTATRRHRRSPRPRWRRRWRRPRSRPSSPFLPVEAVARPRVGERASRLDPERPGRHAPRLAVAAGRPFALAARPCAVAFLQPSELPGAKTDLGRPKRLVFAGAPRRELEHVLLVHPSSFTVV